MEKIFDTIGEIITTDYKNTKIPVKLYRAAFSLLNEPPHLAAARRLCALRAGEEVLILTGFVMSVNLHAETDGVIGAAQIANALSKSGVKVTFACAEQAVAALGALLNDKNTEIIGISTDSDEALHQGGTLLERKNFSLVLSVECPAANEKGIYHSCKGTDISAIEPKCSEVFDLCVSLGIYSVCVGDLGNEIGMGKVAEICNIPELKTCACGCGAGIAAANAADIAVVGTTSEWGCYGILAAMCVLAENEEYLQSPFQEADLLNTAVANGLTDMTGEAVPAVDSIPLQVNCDIIKQLGNLV